MKSISINSRKMIYIWFAGIVAAVVLAVVGITLAGNLQNEAGFASLPLRINAGSNAIYVDSNQVVWQPDQFFIGGNVAVRDQSTGITGGDLEVLRHERWGSSGYAIPVPNGKYQVNLHFAETFTGITAPGQRQFGVDVEGSAIPSLDIFAETGGLNRGLLKSFEVTVNDNQLDIQLSKNAQETAINGVEVFLLESTQPTNPAAVGLRINAGHGADYTDGNGNVWLADQFFIEGNVASRPADAAITGGDGMLFQNERWGGQGYAVPVANGSYRVVLHFAETFTGITAPGQRVFGVNVEGNSVDNIDIFGEAGGRNIVISKGVDVSVGDGLLDIGFVANVQNPFVNAIEIIPINIGAPVAPVPVPPEPQPQPTTQPGPVAGVCPLSQEAEAGTLNGKFVVAQAGEASSGNFVHIPAGNGFASDQEAAADYVEFCFDITTQGNYQLAAFVHAATGKKDSFYVSVNGSNPLDYIWDTDRSRNYLKDYAQNRKDSSPTVFSLAPGRHTIRLHYREEDTRLDRVVLENVGGSAPAPVQPTATAVPIDPLPTATAVPIDPLPTATAIPLPSPTPQSVAPGGQATYTLNPGNLNNQWPSLKAGDIVHLNPGTYTGGNISLSANGSASNPIIIQKTPGTSGKVIFDGNGANHLFDITGSFIEFGGTQVMAGWEPDLVITDYGYAGIRMRNNANDIRLHHIHFKSPGSYAVRFNGQNVIFEYNRIEDPGADVLQAETGGGGVNISNWIIRYNYGSNRLSSSGQWAFNAASHADFVQIQRGPARDIQIYGNLMVGYTNALLVGDSWGSATNVSITDNFILYEANGISTQSRGDVNGNYTIENNHLVMYIVDGVDGGGKSAILLNDTGGSENVSIRCNVFYGAKDTINVNIDSSVDRSSSHNVETGNTTSFSEINSSYVDLGYTMSNARDLAGIKTLSGPVAGADCRQGASFASVDEHYKMVTSR